MKKIKNPPLKPMTVTPKFLLRNDLTPSRSHRSTLKIRVAAVVVNIAIGLLRRKTAKSRLKATRQKSLLRPPKKAARVIIIVNIIIRHHQLIKRTARQKQWQCLHLKHVTTTKKKKSR